MGYLPLLATLAVVAVGLTWLTGTVGVLPLLGGLAIGSMVLSVLIAWSLVKV